MTESKIQATPFFAHFTLSIEIRCESKAFLVMGAELYHIIGEVRPGVQ